MALLFFLSLGLGFNFFFIIIIIFLLSLTDGLTFLFELGPCPALCCGCPLLLQGRGHGRHQTLDGRGLEDGLLGPQESLWGHGISGTAFRNWNINDYKVKWRLDYQLRP